MAKEYRKPNGEVFAAKTLADVKMAEEYGYSPMTNAPVRVREKVESTWYSWLKDRAEDAAAFGVGAATEIGRGGTSAALTTLSDVAPEAVQPTAQGLLNLEQDNPLATVAGKVAGGIATIAPIASAGAAAGSVFGPVGAVVGATAAVGGIAALRFVAGNADEQAKRYFATPGGVESASSATVAKTLFTDNWKWGALEIGLEMVGAGIAAKSAKKTVQTITEKASKVGGIGSELNIVNIPDVVQRQLAERGLNEVAQNLVVKRNLIGKSAGDIAAEMDDVIKQAEGGMTDIKMEATNIALSKKLWEGQLKPLLNQLLRPISGDGRVADTLELINDAAFRPYLGQLQRLKGKDFLGKVVESLTSVGDDLVGDKTKKIFDAYDAIDSTMLALARTQGDDVAERFGQLSKEYSAAIRLKNSVGKGTEKAGFWGTLLKEVPVVGKVAAASPALKYKAAEWIVSKEGKFVQVLDNVFGGVGRGLGGAASAVNYMAPPLPVLKSQEYDRVRASVQQAALDPNSAVELTSKELTDQGVPYDLQGPIIEQNKKVIEFLNSKLPPNDVPGLTLTTNPAALTTKQRQQFSEYVLAATDPAVALQNPTPRIMETLNALYPQTVVKLMETVNDIQADRPYLSPSQKRWISAVTGVPRNKLAIPANNAIINANVQAAEAAGRGPSAFEPSNRNTEMTTSQRLGGGINEE